MAKTPQPTPETSAIDAACAEIVALTGGTMDAPVPDAPAATEREPGSRARHRVRKPRKLSFVTAR
jgi:hypothetical protein